VKISTPTPPPPTKKKKKKGDIVSLKATLDILDLILQRIIIISPVISSSSCYLSKYNMAGYSGENGE
jgi:hypothetical protein